MANHANRPINHPRMANADPDPEPQPTPDPAPAQTITDPTTREAVEASAKMVVVLSKPKQQTVSAGRKAGTSYTVAAHANVSFGPVEIQIPIWVSAAPASDGSGISIRPNIGSVPRGITVSPELADQIEAEIGSAIEVWDQWEAAYDRTVSLLTNKPQSTAKTDRFAPRLVKTDGSRVTASSQQTRPTA